ncbi:MAG: hypothetical protein AB4911_00095 [Oscillochloridaceae bacterium umkhey_bin13]
MQPMTSILDLLDRGLRLYRRGFVGLMLLTMAAALPLGFALALLFFAFEQVSTTLALLALFGAFALGMPLSLYAMGALSRGALMLAAGEPLRLRQALALGPLRVVGMGCYGTMFSLVAGTLVSALSGFIFCVFYLFLGAGIVAIASLGSLGGAAGEAVFSVLGSLVIFGFIMLYAATLVVNGAVYGSVVFAMQPFVHEELGFGGAIQRSLDLVGFRFGHNLLVFLCTSLVFGTAALAATIALGILVPGPILFLLGPESPVARAVAGLAWVLGIAAAVPLLPIWMALLYHERRAIREGDDLVQALHP